jgi:predicted dehydrogenase
MGEKVKVAVLGCGFLGRWHVQKALSLPNCELIAVVEPYLPSRDNVKSFAPSLRFVSSLDEVINEIDAAIVATPTSTHYELGHKLLSAGIHVFMEKPLASKASEAFELSELAKKNKLILQPGHSERCHRAWEKKSEFADFLSSDAIIHLERQAPFKGRATDVDVVQDLMIHDLDLLCFLLGETPNHVESRGLKIRTNKWDFVQSRFRFSKGQIATITVGRNHVEEVRRFEAMSSAGSLKVDLFKNEILIARANSAEVLSESYEKRDHLLMEQTAFFDTIHGARLPFVTAQAGVIAVQLVEAVLNSINIEGGSAIL